ncbi:MAG: hypothetical protein ACLTF6_13875 [Clostridium sp.]
MVCEDLEMLMLQMASRTAVGLHRSVRAYLEEATLAGQYEVAALQT